MYRKLKFAPLERTTFREDLDRKRDDILKDTKRTGNAELFTKAIILGVGWVVTIVTIFTLPYETWWQIAFKFFECVLFGCITAAIGFNIMHDGGHGSFSSRKWVNKLMVLSLNVLGGNATIWKFKHNTVHHTYTNIVDHDDDIELGILARFHPEKKRFWFHRFQAWYVPFLYTLGYLSWIYIHDFKKYFLGKVGNYPFTFTLSQHINFWVSKIVHVIIFWVIPINIFGFWTFLPGFLIATMTTGFLISTVFQLAHVVTQTNMVVATKNADLSDVVAEENAVHQVLTTANFATHSKFWKWFSGGLNFQVEHHLFPNVSHVHYPQLQPAVKEVCKKHGLPYHENKTFFSALREHFAMIDKLGKQEIKLAA
jgi:linoleoyl-CoA desaturase